MADEARFDKVTAFLWKPAWEAGLERLGIGKLSAHCLWENTHLLKYLQVKSLPSLAILKVHQSLSFFFYMLILFSQNVPFLVRAQKSKLWAHPNAEADPAEVPSQSVWERVFQNVLRTHFWAWETDSQPSAHWLLPQMLLLQLCHNTVVRW